jgi:hypothetical protein
LLPPRSARVAQAIERALAPAIGDRDELVEARPLLRRHRLDQQAVQMRVCPRPNPGHGALNAALLLALANGLRRLADRDRQVVVDGYAKMLLRQVNVLSDAKGPHSLPD